MSKNKYFRQPETRIVIARKGVALTKQSPNKLREQFIWVAYPVQRQYKMIKRKWKNNHLFI